MKLLPILVVVGLLVLLAGCTQNNNGVPPLDDNGNGVPPLDDNAMDNIIDNTTDVITTVEISELAKNPEKYLNKEVTVEGYFMREHIARDEWNNTYYNTHYNRSYYSLESNGVMSFKVDEWNKFYTIFVIEDENQGYIESGDDVRIKGIFKQYSVDFCDCIWSYFDGVTDEIIINRENGTQETTCLSQGKSCEPGTEKTFEAPYYYIDSTDNPIQKL